MGCVCASGLERAVPEAQYTETLAETHRHANETMSRPMSSMNISEYLNATVGAHYTLPPRLARTAGRVSSKRKARASTLARVCAPARATAHGAHSPHTP